MLYIRTLLTLTSIDISYFVYSSVYMGFPVAQMVKYLPAMQETQVRSPDQEVPLEKGMTTHPTVLAWRIPWTEDSGRLQCMGWQKVRQD